MNYACHQASIDRRVLDIKRLSGINGLNQRRVIAEYDADRLVSGKRPVKKVDGVLHPAIRKLILETTPKQMALRVFSHLVDVVKGYHARGRILMSAHSHYVALCHAAGRLKLENVLKLTTGAFFSRLVGVMNSIDGRNLTKCETADALNRDLACTIILGRFLTHPGGFERGWADRYKIKGVIYRGDNTYPHGSYYRHFMEPKSPIHITTLNYSKSNVPLASMVFENFHLKTGGAFRALIIPPDVQCSNYLYTGLMDTIKNASGLSADQLTSILHELHTTCGDLPMGMRTFRELFCYIMRGHTGISFSEAQLEKIGRVRTVALDYYRTNRTKCYIRGVARIVAALQDSFPAKAVEYLRKSDFTAMGPTMGIPEFTELAIFAASHCVDVIDVMDTMSVAYMDDVRFKDIGPVTIEKLTNYFPRTALRIEGSLLHQYAKLFQLPGKVEYLQDVSTDVLNLIFNCVFNNASDPTVSTACLVKERTGRSWKRLGMTRISAYSVGLHSLRFFVKRLVNWFVLPAMGELKRAREEKEDGDDDNDEESGRYAKYIRLQ